ncbi:GPI transamidase component PIG-T-like [Octopus vulgaris]|uniref:GPI transamidase component PIG-T-like n=1 Tax=Octopus vulgaris TaxID=6645 RepID=A0AA36EVU5_OCTVU|nr:GPI transamidase component PIG-T-like [Octopus vulgaris]
MDVCRHNVVCLSLTCLLFIITAVTAAEDKFSEELFIKTLPSGHVYFHFQFITRWDVDIRNKSEFNQYRLFPKSLGDIVSAHDVQELHLSLTQGIWRHDKWGYPIHDAPPGAELWVWFLPSVKSVKVSWAELVNALSGLFCASLNFMDAKSTVNPNWSFRPHGLQGEGFAKDVKLLRYSALPREVVCTENLTPWKKLLPCDSKVGLASLFNAMKLYDTAYHSLSVHLRSVCRDESCVNPSVELTQSLSVIFDPTMKNNGYKNWSLRKLFGRSLRNQCPLASHSNIYIDADCVQDSDYQCHLSPEPDEMTSFTLKEENFSYGVYSVGKHTRNGNFFNIGLNYVQQPKYTSIVPPPLYVHQYITGYGLENGGIICHLYNKLPEKLKVIYLQSIPWFMRVYFNSVKIISAETTIQPIAINYIQGKDRVQPYTLEIVVELPPNSVSSLSFDFDRAFLKWTEYPPDANHGFYINSAVISAILPVARNYTSPRQQSSVLIDRESADSDQLLVRIHTENLLLSLPTPDFSMPYNVICLACTVIAIAFGSIHNLTTRRLVAKDPDLKTGLKHTIKKYLQKLF